MGSVAYWWSTCLTHEAQGLISNTPKKKKKGLKVDGRLLRTKGPAGIRRDKRRQWGVNITKNILHVSMKMSCLYA